ncbi:hypothetical protein [Ascidiimonas aurantiaca]|uniref:hypothetical protein n=1 Tax=Ascidiimonas aurantiaca TaxID=1685432 RepID=UPI0030ED2156
MRDLSVITQKDIEFGNRVLGLVQKVQPYVKHRLYTAESSGIVPRNMYKAAEITDDAIIDLYKDFDKNINDKNLSIKLFSLLQAKLNTLFKKEAIRTRTVSVSELLSEELEQFEERFETDIDNDLLMPEELDDISYHQEEQAQPQFLYEDAEKNIISTLEIQDSKKDLTPGKREVLNRIYNWLPLETSDVIDLLVFGRLTYEEIAQVKQTDVETIKLTVQTVQRNMRKNLN